MPVIVEFSLEVHGIAPSAELFERANAFIAARGFDDAVLVDFVGAPAVLAAYTSEPVEVTDRTWMRAVAEQWSATFGPEGRPTVKLDFEDVAEEPPYSPAADPFGLDPLLRAAARDDLRTVGALVDAGADVNARGAVGWTALHVATLYDQIEVVEYLLDAGARPHTKDAFGCSAHWLAAAFADDDCAALFPNTARTRVRGIRPEQFAYAGPDTWLVEYTLTVPSDAPMPRVRDIARALDRKTVELLRMVRGGQPIEAVPLARLRHIFEDFDPLTSGLSWAPAMPDPLLWSDRERRITQLYAALGAQDPQPFRRILRGYDRFASLESNGARR